MLSERVLEAFVRRVRYWGANSAYLRRPRDPDAPVYEPLEKLFPGPSEEESI